jgi:NAD(P)-dependent dehydrogenase (short-subunit alcohol dehydrogenase family)
MSCRMSTYVVTGANRGIGLEMVRQLVGRGERVVACCRRASDDLKQTGARVVENVDVADSVSVDALASTLADETIDVLVNNAGILEADDLSELDFDAIERQLRVNALGPLRVTKALMSRLSRPAKVVIVTSRMGSIADNDSGRMYGYRMSKAAVNAAGRSLARDLRHCDVAVALLHPGFVKTRMTHERGNVAPEDAAAGLIARIDELNLRNSGRFLHANGEELPW